MYIYYLRYERPCQSIGYTNSSRRRELGCIICRIKHGCPYWKVLVIRMDVNVRIFVENPRNMTDIRWENRTKSLCKSAEFWIRYTTIDYTLISFVFSSSWIINVVYIYIYVYNGLILVSIECSMLYSRAVFIKGFKN